MGKTAARKAKLNYGRWVSWGAALDQLLEGTVDG